MPSYKKSAVLTSALLFLSTTTSALTLNEAYLLAEQTDPTFQLQKLDLDLAGEQVTQAKAGLLPQLNLQASKLKNKRKYHYDDPGVSVSESYGSQALQLNLKQAVWQHAAFINYGQTKLAHTQAEYHYQQAQQELALRLVQAWFDVLSGQSALIAAKEQLKFRQHNLNQVSRQHDLKVSSDTEFADAKNLLETAQAELTLAQSNISIKQAELENMIGSESDLRALPHLSLDYVLPDLQQSNLVHWQKQSEKQNPDLLAAQQALTVAQEEVRKQQAGHEPTVDLVASYGKDSQGSGVNGGQSGFDSRLRTIGLQLNMPLYSGGTQSSKVNEARILQNKANTQLLKVRRAVLSNTKQAWFNWQSNEAKKSAAEQQVNQAELQQRANIAANTRGVKTDLEVLEARYNYASAMSSLQQARYQILLSYFQLKAVSGELTANDLSELKFAQTSDIFKLKGELLFAELWHNRQFAAN